MTFIHEKATAIRSEGARMIGRLDSIVLFLNRQAVIWMIGLMAVMVMANVTLRFFVGDSILWAEETSRYLMIWATFIGSGLLFRQGAHIAVDNLQDALPENLGRVLRMAIVAILLCFFAAMIYLGTLYTMAQWDQITPVTRISSGFVYAALPVGFVLMVFHTLMIARQWVNDRHFAEQADGQIFGAE